MSRPSVGSSSTSSLASIAITSARCSCVTMPFDSSLTRLVFLMSLRDRKCSQTSRRKRGCVAATNSISWETRIQRGSTATSAMKQTSCISWWRWRNGLRPRTESSPSKRVRPSRALSAVVLPAPFGPIRPTMRPGWTRKFTSSRARVEPKVLPRPRATIRSVTLPLLLRVVGGIVPYGRKRRGRRGRNLVERVQQFLGVEAESLDAARDLGPLLLQEKLALVFQERAARAFGHEHPAPAALLDQVLVDQLLVSLEDRQGVQAIFGRDAPYRRQRVAVVEHALEDHRHHAVAQLAVDRQAVVPVGVHSFAEVS